MLPIKYLGYVCGDTQREQGINDKAVLHKPTLPCAMQWQACARLCARSRLSLTPGPDSADSSRDELHTGAGIPVDSS